MKIKKYLSILCGAGILAFAIYNIHSRCAISEGGALGLSLLVYHWLHISPGISNLVIDGSALIAGTIILKNTFLKDSIIASLSYSLWYRVFELSDPILPGLTAYPLLAAVLGGVLIGVGASLIVRYGCAAGADDSLALIFHEKTHRHISVFYVISDFSVLLLSLSYIPVTRIMWSWLSVIISSGVIALLCPNENEDQDS